MVLPNSICMEFSDVTTTGDERTGQLPCIERNTAYCFDLGGAAASSPFYGISQNICSRVPGHELLGCDRAKFMLASIIYRIS